LTILNRISYHILTDHSRQIGGDIYQSHWTSDLGKLIISATDQGICFCSFESENDAENILGLFPNHQIRNAENEWTKSAKSFLENGCHSGPQLSLHVWGTNFQHLVWKATIEIGSGEILSYHALAIRIGNPHSARAVGHALAQNPIAIFIPCHRVWSSANQNVGYKWGKWRKNELVLKERSAIPNSRLLF